jgi:hypothetical protein
MLPDFIPQVREMLCYLRVVFHHSAPYKPSKARQSSVWGGQAACSSRQPTANCLINGSGLARDAFG